MKTLDEFKAEYDGLIISHMDREQKHSAKEVRAARKQAKRLSLAIRLMEQGVTEDVLKNERTGIKKRMQILDSRFSVPAGSEGAAKMLRKEYEKKNGYADMRKQYGLIRFIINF